MLGRRTPTRCLGHWLCEHALRIMVGKEERDDGREERDRQATNLERLLSANGVVACAKKDRTRDGLKQ